MIKIEPSRIERMKERPWELTTIIQRLSLVELEKRSPESYQIINSHDHTLIIQLYHLIIGNIIENKFA